MTNRPRNDAEWARQVERRLRRLESRLHPWQVEKGANGDLVAYNVATGQRTVIAELAIDDQPVKED